MYISFDFTSLFVDLLVVFHMQTVFEADMFFLFIQSLKMIALTKNFENTTVMEYYYCTFVILKTAWNFKLLTITSAFLQFLYSQFSCLLRCFWPFLIICSVGCLSKKINYPWADKYFFVITFLFNKNYNSSTKIRLIKKHSSQKNITKFGLILIKKSTPFWNKKALSWYSSNLL